MADPAAHGITAAEAAAAMVLTYAPLLRRAVRLPTYAQPALTWDVAPTCDPAFAAYLRATWRRLDLREAAQFSAAEALLFRFLRLHGLGKLYGLSLTAQDRLAPPSWHARQLLELCLNLGTLLAEKLLALMPPAAREEWLPWHGFDVYRGKAPTTLTLAADSLAVAQSATGQPLYLAPTRPTVLVQGVRGPVAFTAHAIQRMQDRRVAAPRSHASLHDLFAFVAYNTHLEPATLYGGQPAVALFDRCMPGFFVYHYVEALVDAPPQGQRYLYRLGYCPLARDGDLWVAKTLLMPGYGGTPEYGALLQASLAPGVKERLLKACEALSTPHLAATGDFGLVRWFHTHGVPQVIPAPADAYTRPVPGAAGRPGDA